MSSGVSKFAFSPHAEQLCEYYSSLSRSLKVKFVFLIPCERFLSRLNIGRNNDAQSKLFEFYNLQNFCPLFAIVWIAEAAFSMT